ncbi:hypothetical protein N9B82_03175 [Saprospiraceae bacterium]|nr:hypothetical protein [Saprospiraceae bacterium]
MTDTLANALLLMFVGMITVFAILSIVVIAGRALIKAVNYFTEDPIENQIPKEHLAVITAISANITDGQAHQLKIEKL